MEGEKQNDHLGEFTSTQTAIIVVLLAIAAVLGYVLYAGIPSGGGGENTQNEQQEEQTNGGMSENEEMTDRERVLSFTPNENTTAEDRQEHFLLVRELAQQSSTIEVSNCQTEPVVLQTTIGVELTLQNSGDSPIFIGLNQNNGQTIEPEGDWTVTIGEDVFTNGSGVYAYTCAVGEGGPQRGGIIFIQPEGSSQ